MSENVALVYFTKAGTDIFPKHPNDAEEMRLSIYKADSPTTWTKTYCEDTELYGSVEEIVNRAAGRIHEQNCSRIYSIHAKSMFLRTYRRHLLKVFTNETECQSLFSKTASKTIDLCDKYHYPAIITYEERTKFCMSDIKTFFDVDPCILNKELDKQLVRRFCMKFY